MWDGGLLTSGTETKSWMKPSSCTMTGIHSFSPHPKPSVVKNSTMCQIYIFFLDIFAHTEWIRLCVPKYARRLVLD